MVNQEEKCPRVLVISHNVFSESGNMGKTMMHMLAGIPPQQLAQLYFHQEIPTRACCLRYFRITDSDVLHSVVTRKARYRIFTEQDIDETTSVSRTDKGNLAKVYQFSRRRTPAIYFLRNLMWSIGKWKSKALEDWAKAFEPDVIFLAASDYAFPYQVALYLSKLLSVPIVMWCADDHYIMPGKNGTPVRRIQCRRLLRLAKQVAAQAKTVITISDRMQKDYAALFGFPTKTIRISAGINAQALPMQQRSGIAYVGNLGINRIAPLAELGRALKQAGLPEFPTIQVYTGEKNPAILQQINEENGLTNCGYLPGNQVEALLGKSKFLLITEDFGEQSIRRTKYSLSTKVAESLRSGACIFAYGPPEIASISYLREYHAACVLERAADFPEKIVQLCQHPEQYAGYVQDAQALAERFHCASTNETIMEEILLEAIQTAKETEEI